MLTASEFREVMSCMKLGALSYSH